MHRFVRLALIAFGLLNFSASASGHSLWLIEHEGKTCLTFSEDPMPGAIHLQNKAKEGIVLGSQGRAARDAESLEVIDLKDETGFIALPEGVERHASVHAVWAYGLFEKGDAPAYLIFSAKRVRSGITTLRETAVETNDLDLAIDASGGVTTVSVSLRGAPVAKAELTTWQEGSDEETLFSDADGKAALPATQAGKARYVRVMERREESGEDNGRKFNHRLWVATLLIAGADADYAAASEHETSATDLLAAARANRSVWDDFSGGSCELSINSGGERADGRMDISAAGEVSLSLPEGKLKSWCDVTLKSLVSHRLPSNELGSDAEYMMEDFVHPLGRKIGLNGDGMGSSYRISENIVKEVNREFPGGRFRISVLETSRDAEGRYLPKTWVVNTWDKEGKLKSSSHSHQVWQEIGGRVMPRVLTVLEASEGEDRVISVAFENWRLGPQKAAAQSQQP